MKSDTCRIHAREARRTVLREAAAPRIGWVSALVFAAVATMMLGSLTFSALNTYLATGVAFMYAVLLHTNATLAAYFYFYRKGEARVTGGIIAGLCSLIAFGIAAYRGLIWFEGSVVVALLVASLEPLGIAVTGWATGTAQHALDRVEIYADHTPKEGDS